MTSDFVALFILLKIQNNPHPAVQTLQNTHKVPLLTEEVRRELLAGLSVGVSQILPSGWPSVSKTADSKGQMLARHGTAAGEGKTYIKTQTTAVLCVRLLLSVWLD